MPWHWCRLSPLQNGDRAGQKSADTNLQPAETRQVLSEFPLLGERPRTRGCRFEQTWCPLAHESTFPKLRIGVARPQTSLHRDPNLHTPLVLLRCSIPIPSSGWNSGQCGPQQHTGACLPLWQETARVRGSSSFTSATYYVGLESLFRGLHRVWCRSLGCLAPRIVVAAQGVERLRSQSTMLCQVPSPWNP